LPSVAVVTAFKLDTPTSISLVSIVFAGAGHSGLSTVTLRALISAADRKCPVVAGSAGHAFRSTAATIAIAIAIASAVFPKYIETDPVGKAW
jgi:hypothetical protein